MHGFWRHPALPIGLVLLILGLGNWAVSRDKIREYTRRAAAPPPLDQQASLEQFKHLTPRTNALLLERLHRGLGDYGVAEAKRDFYTIVQSGGRFIAVLGLLLMSVGLLQRWRWRRMARLRRTSMSTRSALPPAPRGA